MLTYKVQGLIGQAQGRRRRATSRIIYAAAEPPSVLAVWSSRLAMFAAAALFVTLALHRLMGLPTPVALTIALACFGAAALAFLMALIAGLDIWMTGRQGAARVIVGFFVSIGLLAIPGVTYVLSKSWPPISDVSTDLIEPPEFTRAQELRGPVLRLAQNPIDYPGERAAALQRARYPDLKALIIPRSGSQAYGLVLQALAKLRYQTTFAVPPDDAEGSPGFIEFSERTMILGLTDDVVIRVVGEEATSRIDIRSASRFGSNDFGGNAERVRMVLKEIVGRLEASIPEQRGDVTVGGRRKQLRGRPGRDPASAVNQRRPDPSRSRIRRAPERRE